MATRTYDLAVFGATGFTGGLVAAYLSEHAPPTTRWALAGRSLDKLESLEKQLAPAHCPPSGIERADLSEPDTLGRLAGQARVLLSTVGPYLRFGEPVVESCVQAGTHYLDITGEPAFVASVEQRFDARAKASQVALVSCCGFDSIPHDLGAFYTAGLLPADAPMKIRGYVAASGGFSGGTWHSALGILKDLPLLPRRGRAKRASESRRVRALHLGLHRESELGFYGLPLPTIDPWIVRKSARALERYGPDFQYGHYLRTRSLPKALGLSVGAASVVLLSKLPPTRALLGRVKEPGEGPSDEARARGFFSVIFVGEAGGQRVVTEVRGGDPGYSETAKMLSESALCLAFDEARPAVFGALTPAVAMGEVLIHRLQARGISFGSR